jgi:hypothetical protein
MQGHVKGLHRHIELALPRLVAFVAGLEVVQQKAIEEIGKDSVHLIGWAWLHRAILGKHHQIQVSDFPQEWHQNAKELLSAWDLAVRASSCVENWHSVLRPFRGFCIEASQQGCLLSWLFGIIIALLLVVCTKG